MIETQRLDPERDRFRISCHRDTTGLERSIKQVGCIEPVLLRNREAPEIVSGFRRVEAAKSAGIERLPAVFLPEETGDADALIIALELFLSTNSPNPVEQSLALRKLEEHFSKEEILGRFFPLLGIEPAAVIYRRVRAILDLPESARQALADGRLDPVCVPFLDRLSESDREPAIDLLLALHPTKSMQKEILEYLHDLTIRDDVPVEEILNDEAVQKILARKPANLPQQRDAFRRWLKTRRFPMLSRAREAFERTRSQWKLGSEVKLVPPPYFEGRQYEIRFAFRDADEFAERLQRLEKMKDEPNLLKKLWE